MQISIPYGEHTLSAEADWFDVLGTLDVGDAPPLPDAAGALVCALDTPIGFDRPLSARLRPGASVAIVVSDSFRKTGVHTYLPALLEYLAAGGIADTDISFLVATGSHRAPTATELDGILGPAVRERFSDRIHSHDPNDRSNLVFRGITSRGTPAWLNRRALEADVLIVTGTVVLHYFGGFGGGRKSIVPGLAGLETIAANHALNLDPAVDRLNPDVAIGRLAGNPVAEDMLEGALLGPEAFLINTVLNRAGGIAGLFAGDLVAAHATACALAESLYVTPVSEPADLVIASAGNAKNFIQSHKALYNACQALKPDGRLILATPAPEGYGGNKFAEWLGLETREAIIAALRRNAEINGQTALSTLDKAPRTTFITEMPEELVHGMGGRKEADLAAALASARRELIGTAKGRPTAWLMPAAASTVPRLPVAGAPGLGTP